MFARSFAGAIVVALTLAFTGGTVAAQKQDGLVNVMVGDVTILKDLNVNVAAQAAVVACELVGPVAAGVLGRAVAVDRSGRSQTICRTDQGDVVITQN